MQAIINKATEIQQAGAGASTPPAAVSQSTTAGPSAATVAAKAAAADAATARGSPSAAAAAAPDSGSVDGTQRLLFSLDVNLGGAQGKVPLNVHAGAVPAELAQQFATQYGLGSTAVSQLTEAIVSEAKQQVRATTVGHMIVVSDSGWPHSLPIVDDVMMHCCSNDCSRRNSCSR